MQGSGTSQQISSAQAEVNSAQSTLDTALAEQSTAVTKASTATQATVSMAINQSFAAQETLEAAQLVVDRLNEISSQDEIDAAQIALQSAQDNVDQAEQSKLAIIDASAITQEASTIASNESADAVSELEAAQAAYNASQTSVLLDALNIARLNAENAEAKMIDAINEASKATQRAVEIANNDADRAYEEIEEARTALEGLDAATIEEIAAAQAIIDAAEAEFIVLQQTKVTATVEATQATQAAVDLASSDVVELPRRRSCASCI